MSIRIASFNVLNLFERPKVFNFRDRSVGDTLLKRIGEFRKLLKNGSYTTEDKRKIVKAFTFDGGTVESAKLSKYISVREDQGKFWKRTNRKISGVSLCSNSGTCLWISSDMAFTV